jgi:hypothetical protein
VVATYKSLSTVERTFPSLKSVDRKDRPIDHHQAGRVKAQVLLCMEWQMRPAPVPLLFDDEDPAAAQAQRTSMVAPAHAPSRRIAGTQLPELAGGPGHAHAQSSSLGRTSVRHVGYTDGSPAAGLELLQVRPQLYPERNIRKPLQTT